MNILKLLIILIASVVFISGCRDNYFSRVSGGSCEYKSYSGVLTIEEVRYDPGEKEKDYLVSYKFEAENADSNESRRTASNLPERLTKEQITKGDVKPGKKFRTNANYIVSGTCAPGPEVDDFEKWR